MDLQERKYTLEKELEHLLKAFKAGMMNQEEFLQAKERVDDRLTEVNEKLDKQNESTQLIANILDGRDTIPEEPLKAKKGYSSDDADDSSDDDDDDDIKAAPKKATALPVPKKQHHPPVQEKVKLRVQEKKSHSFAILQSHKHKQKKDVKVLQAKKQRLPVHEPSSVQQESISHSSSGLVEVVGVIVGITLLIVILFFALKYDANTGNAPLNITLVEYVDFSSPSSAQMHPVIKQLRREQQVNYTMQYMFYTEDSFHAAQAVECAKEQGNDDAYLDVLFANRQSLSMESLVLYAQQAKLDMAFFSSCLGEEKYSSLVLDQNAQAKKDGIIGTPVYIINGEKLVGTQMYASFLSAAQ